MNPLVEIGSADLVSRLEELGRVQAYATDATVFEQGDQPENFPIVLSGRVKIFRFLTPGKEIIVNVFGAGEAFAIPPVIDHTAYPATAVALVNSELLLINRTDFLRLLGESAEFSRFVMLRMSGLLRETTRSIEIQATTSPEKKIASVLMWLAEKEFHATPVVISLRRQDIAQIAGLATETTIRTIRKFSEYKVLSIVKGKIVLDDLEALEKYCKT